MKLVAHTFERIKYKIKIQHWNEQSIKLKDNIKINQGKKEENFPYSRGNPSTNLQFYNNSSKVVIDKLREKTKEKKNKLQE